MIRLSVLQCLPAPVVNSLPSNCRRTGTALVQQFHKASNNFISQWLSQVETDGSYFHLS